MEDVRIDKRRIGSGEAPYIIAEIGSNHNGDMELCRRLIDAAAEAGADAVKFQSWSDSSLIAKEEYDRNTSYDDKKKHFGSLREMVEAYQFTPEQHRMAASYCREKGITFCSTPFSPPEVDLLESLEVPFYKIASMDVTNPALLDYVARKQKPVVISTGMATLGEIENAVNRVRSAGNRQIVLLHCVSIYPPDMRIVHLRNMQTLQAAFDVPVGFSDHTLGTAIPIAAVALGACVIEKHFTLDKDMEGWDHAISADPGELRVIVQESRNVVAALGSRARQISEQEIAKRKRFRRSLVTRHALNPGHVIGMEDLDAKRPGTGISPDQVELVVGRKVANQLAADQVIHWSHLT